MAQAQSQIKRMIEMDKIEEIKEALDAVDWPEHEFRSYCYELLGRLEEAEKVAQDVRVVVNNTEKSQSVKLILVNEIITRYEFWLHN